jgi:hypothetical protein
MNWRCRWFGHKRRSLDGNSATVSIYNVDACARCGCILRAEKARSFGYIENAPAIDLGDDYRAAIANYQREIERRMFLGD